MEKKTIGQFIAALRKASGMTQKQLSERLNVSDKAVSRWERDECAPDLSLIPVIAEIFGVTSDEILRGERKFGEADISEYPVTSAKSTKQVERILNDAKLKFSIRSIISVGIAIVGLLGAMLCNFGFNRAHIGFIVACVLYLAAAVCETIFVKLAFASVSGDELENEKTELCKKDFYNTAILSYFVVFVLFAATLPLVVLVGDSHWGLTAESWFYYGLGYGFSSLFICFLVKVFAGRFALRAGVYTLPEKERECADKVYKFDKKMLLILVLVVSVTLMSMLGFSGLASIEMFIDGRTFENVEDFIEFMETPYRDNGRYYDSASIYYEDGSDNETVSDYNYYVDGEPVDTIPEDSMLYDFFQYYGYTSETFYDEFGNISMDDIPLIRRIYDENGERFETFIQRNNTVSKWDVDWDGDKPTFTVYTDDDYARFYAIGNDINSMLAVLCVIEILVIGSIWFILRRKIK